MHCNEVSLMPPICRPIGDRRPVRLSLSCPATAPCRLTANEKMTEKSIFMFYNAIFLKIR